MLCIKVEEKKEAKLFCLLTILDCSKASGAKSFLLLVSDQWSPADDPYKRQGLVGDNDHLGKGKNLRARGESSSFDGHLISRWLLSSLMITIIFQCDLHLFKLLNWLIRG